MPRKHNYRRITRGLRFRLTFSYALFFAVLLGGVAALFRARLASTLDDQAKTVVEQEWAAMKGYLRIEKNQNTQQNDSWWYWDPDDSDESRIVLNIQRMYLIADSNGNVIHDGKSGEDAVSSAYMEVGTDPPAQIRGRIREVMAGNRPNALPIWTVRRSPKGVPFLIRAGIVFDEGLHHQPYYVAIGRELTPYNAILTQFTLIYAGVIPVALILGLLLGWFMAGRALEPVLAVAQTAQRISGSNLSLRIPTRHADDELDYLILTFNRMIERLEASFQQMKQFSIDVSHELRTPITAIRGQLEVALFTAKTTEQYRDAIVNALQDIDRLSQIVRALLLLSQAESGQVVLQKTSVDLSKVVADIVEQFQIPAEAEAVRLNAEMPRECPAEVDRMQIERMLTNLLSNAIKFTPEGGDVRVKLKRLPAAAEIIVEDTGRGIPNAYLPHIFDRFYRVPGSGTAPGPDQGLGLGLSFVSWIVKAHHGTVDVESTPGRGTRFTVVLPLDEARPSTRELTAEPVMHEL